MKASLHFGGTKNPGDPNHNCRNFDTSKAAHINEDMMIQNKYIGVYQEEEMMKDFDLMEQTFYEKNFSHILQRQNENALKHRKKDRVKDMEKFRKTKKNAVEETLVQLGDMYDHTDPKKLMAAYEKLAQYNNELTKGHCKILNVALHVDESTPHIHSRHVWVYNDYDNLDKDGNPTIGIGKDKALKQAGIERPYPDEPEGRNNNRTMTYTKLLRDKYYEILKDMELEIDTIPKKMPHMQKRDYLNQIEADRKASERLREEKKKYKDHFKKESDKFFEEHGYRIKSPYDDKETKKKNR